jgi:hypothetical protein
MKRLQTLGRGLAWIFGAAGALCGLIALLGEWIPSADLAPAPVMAIDHVFAGQGWPSVDVRRGPRLGSDHYPVVVDVAGRPPVRRQKAFFALKAHPGAPCTVHLHGQLMVHLDERKQDFARVHFDFTI